MFTLTGYTKQHGRVRVEDAEYEHKRTFFLHKICTLFFG